MKAKLGIAAVVFSLSFSAAQAQTLDPTASESRDAAAAFLGSTHFLIGRIGSDCLALVGRQETPKEFVAEWEQRNAKYYSASIKYMGKRLDAALAAGGTSARDAVVQAYGAAVRSGGEGSAEDWFKSGAKEDVCQRVVSLIDAGSMDVNPKLKMFDELQSLAACASVN